MATAKLARAAWATLSSVAEQAERAYREAFSESIDRMGFSAHACSMMLAATDNIQSARTIRISKSSSMSKFESVRVLM